MTSEDRQRDSETSAEFAIETRSVSKSFGGVQALDSVSIQVRKGELLAICGENGAGKSTLMKILCGQHVDYQGTVLLDGKPIRFSGIKDAESQGISIIHQELNLVEELSVAANIFLGREVARGGFLNSRAMDQEARALLARLDCEIPPSTLAGRLRVGDQQLIEIAKSLSLGASILIMDEPTSALTDVEAARLDHVIAQLREQEVTILYISHKMDEIFRLADRITVLRDGRLVETVQKDDVSPKQIAHLMVGREFAIDQKTSARESDSERPILEVENLWRRWPGHPRQWRLQDINFSVSAGEIVGFAGLMGAGRTELFECLFGNDDDESTGRILIDGKPVSFRHPNEAIQAGVAMVTEDRKRTGIFRNLNVRENMTLCSLGQDQFAKVLIGPSAEANRCHDSINRLQIKTESPQSLIGSLSGGNQQKCMIGRSLLTDPKILLLDDPTRGVDIGAKSEIYQLMRAQAARGVAVLMTSSELPELLMVCHRIVVLCEGHQTAILSSAEASEQKIMEFATQVPGHSNAKSGQN